MNNEELMRFAQALYPLAHVIADWVRKGMTLENLMDAVDRVLPAAALMVLEAEKGVKQ